MRKTLSRSSFVFMALSFSGCVTVPNTRACSVAGQLSAGMICGETLTDKTSELTLEETLEFLSPRPGSPGVPARAGAICQSAEDWNKQKSALEAACRALGRRCSYEIKQAIESFRAPVK